MAVKIPVGIIKAIDESLRLKNEIEMLTAERTEYNDTVKQYMSDHELDVIETKKAQAAYSTREGKTIDPESFLEAVGGDIDKLLAAASIRMDSNPKTGKAGAKSYLGEEEIASICETSDIPVLTVKKLPMVQKAPVAAPPPKRKISVRLPSRHTMTA